MLYAQSKVYMIADDETEETLTLVAMLEGIALNRLCENIDLHRSAGCGFARAARIFAANYLHAFLDNKHTNLPESYSNALAMQRAMVAVSNDAEETAPATRS